MIRWLVSKFLQLLLIPREERMTIDVDEELERICPTDDDWDEDYYEDSWLDDEDDWDEDTCGCYDDEEWDDDDD